MDLDHDRNPTLTDGGVHFEPDFHLPERWGSARVRVEGVVTAERSLTTILV
jgi:hypothetical protein